jgi:7-carboxy-7-deazaguanine synthase
MDKQARISEIFLSHQGEGPYAGSRQLFIRFYGCNLRCGYCDTYLDSYKTVDEQGLLGKVLDFEDDYNELVLTGGEPLLHAGFLTRFLPMFRSHRAMRVYLETNGTLPEDLEKVVDLVDVVSMDVKLPSSDGSESVLWDKHEKFMEIASRRELIVKAVVTDSTSMEDVKRMSLMIGGVEGDIVVVLQPATVVNDLVREADCEMLSFFKGYIAKETGKSVVILGQIHKLMGIR